MKPLVTIALPVYNGANTLKLAIDSILNQGFEDWELIIIDDASTDQSLEIMQSFNDPRIRLVAGENNLGLSVRLNMAVDMARGNFFARMDQDDVSYPQRIEQQVKYLQQNSEIDLLAAATMVFKGEGEALGRLPVLRDHEEICARPWNGFHLPHPTWVGKTEWFRRNRYDSYTDGAEDQQLLLRTYRFSKFACLEEPLLAYREGVRSMKKMFRSRRVFAYAYIRQFLLEKQYFMAIKVGIFTLLKVGADVLNLVFGVASMRNKLRTLSKEEQMKWKTIWDELKYI